jgi:hypothetical protein
MSLLADAAQPLLVSSVLDVTGPCPPITVQDLIVSPRSSYALAFSAANQNVVLDFRDRSAIADATASDASRLSTAAMQTISTLGDDLLSKDRLPWGLIRLYYAAFYSAHCLLRLLGRSYCHLESRHVGRLTSLANTIGTPAPFPIQAGMYQCLVNDAFTALILSKAGAASPGGSHESFWTYFEAQLREVGDKILAGPLAASDSQVVVAKLEDFRRLTEHRAAFGWLSKMRNEVQYRQSYAVWFPCSVSKQERRTLGRLAAGWEADPMGLPLTVAPGDVLKRFVLACVFPISFCYVVLNRIQERSSIRSRSFVRYGHAAYLSEIARGR